MHQQLAMLCHAYGRVLKCTKLKWQNEKNITWVVEFCLNLMNLDILMEKEDALLLSSAMCI